MGPQRARVVGSVEELLAGATERVEVFPDDGKSGSRFWKVVIDGSPYFCKTLSRRTDWIMRVTHDRDQRTVRIWEAGVMDDAPPCIDHTVVAMSLEGSGDDAVIGVLMHDVADHLIPEGDDPLTAEQHEGFLAHLAALSAATWGWDDPLGLTTMAERVRFFAPDNLLLELEADDVPGPVAAADEGWRRLVERAPGLAALTAVVHARPGPLLDAWATTPSCFLHGDWKAGNLGRHPDGRTILIDWAYPGAGPCTWDLAWYLALNRARLPESKEAAVERFRSELDGLGIDTAGWFDAQLELSMLGMATCFGWEKALGPDDELGWWAGRAAAGARRVPALVDLAADAEADAVRLASGP